MARSGPACAGNPISTKMKHKTVLPLVKRNPNISMLPRFHVDRKEPGPDASEPLGQADADDPSQCRIVGGVVVGLAGERWLRVGRMPVEQVRDPQVEANLPDAGTIQIGRASCRERGCKYV